ncbi:retroviral-like aspartic protease family protein [bacterium]|nr:retroviral-like aspartic protease family protein [bacterium]
MKQMMFYMLSGLMILVNGCSINPSTVSVAPFTGFGETAAPGPADQEEGWEALQHWQLDSAGSHPKFAEALRYVLAGQFDSAEQIMAGIVADPPDSLSLKYALAVLKELYIQQSDWPALLIMDAQSDSGLDRQNTAGLARAFSRATAEEYHFPDVPVVLPTGLSLSGVPEIEVTVNGVRKKFWIDTGASFSVLASDFAQTCGVFPAGNEKVMSETATELQVQIQPAVIDTLCIGGLTVCHHPAIILNKKDLEFKLFGLFRILKINGILGWNAIRNLDMTIDYKNGKTTIRESAAAEPESRNFYWLGYPMVRGYDTQGRSLVFDLDTGANATSLYSAILTKIDTTGIKSKEIHMGGAGGELQKVETYEIPAFSLVLDDYVLHFERIHCNDGGYGVFFQTMGVLGSDMAKSGSIRLDYRNGVFDPEFPAGE